MIKNQDLCHGTSQVLKTSEEVSEVTYLWYSTNQPQDEPKAQQTTSVSIGKQNPFLLNTDHAYFADDRKARKNIAQAGTGEIRYTQSNMFAHHSSRSI